MTAPASSSKKVLLFAIRKLMRCLGISKSNLNALTHVNQYKLFIDRSEDLSYSHCNHSKLKKKDMLKLYILFKIPMKHPDAHGLLTGKVLRRAKKVHAQLLAAEEIVEVAEVARERVPSAAMRKVWVKDAPALVEWVCANHGEHLMFARNLLDGVAVEVGGGGFWLIDDEVLWGAVMDEMTGLIEEGIADKSSAKVRAIVNTFCFSCVPFTADGRQLIAISERFHRLLMMLCAFSSVLSDEVSDMTRTAIRALSFVTELVKFVRGEEALAALAIDQLFDRVLLPKMHRLIASHAEDLVDLKHVNLLKTLGGGAVGSAKDGRAWREFISLITST